MANKYVDALIAAAWAEVGYIEKASNAQLEDKTANAGKANWTKYGAWYGMNGVPWCAIFVSWCAHKARIPETVIPKFHSCGAAIEWFKARGRFFRRADYVPVAGDIIFFQNNSDRHVGIVTGLMSAAVHTIEGNTSGGSTMISNGGGVAEKHYSPFYMRILGYAHPDYESISGAAPKIPTAILRRGSKGDDVRTLQLKLREAKLYWGQLDGDFGPQTLEAVKSFQAAHGLIVDGVVGPKTWAELFS